MFNRLPREERIRQWAEAPLLWPQPVSAPGIPDNVWPDASVSDAESTCLALERLDATGRIQATELDRDLLKGTALLTLLEN